MADVELADVSLDLLPGDGLLMYTDGITEARSGDEFSGSERVSACVAGLLGADAAELTHGLMEQVLSFQHDDPRDDVAVLCLTVPTN